LRSTDCYACNTGNLEAITAFMHAKFTNLAKTYRESALEQKKILLCSIFLDGMLWTYPGLSNTGISPFYKAFLDVERKGVLIGALERLSFEHLVEWLEQFRKGFE
jgi:hypothetical protein